MYRLLGRLSEIRTIRPSVHLKGVAAVSWAECLDRELHGLGMRGCTSQQVLSS